MEKKSILVIEDNLEMRENISEILELSNYSVTTAEDGKKGVAAAKADLPDLIICDVMMPELDGYGVLHMLGKDPKTLSIPFIFLTAKSESVDVRKGMGMGADDYITKPFEEMDLLDAIEMRLKKSEALKSGSTRNITGIQGFMATASGRVIEQVTKNHRTKQYSLKEFVFREGDSPVYLYFLSKGKVKTFKMNDDGKEYITGLYNSGDFFGYAALLEQANYAESAQVIDDAEVLLIPKDDFYHLMNSNTEVIGSFIKLLADNIHQKEEQLIELAYSSVRKRVANALVQVYEKYNTENREEFTISLGREDLASIVGTATETVIRALSEFKQDKFIESKGRDIHVLDIQALRDYRF
ncbi:MAG TPA: transcriptional regulator [Flavobacteriales bacterium]|nr:transcriptional regulator [Flavobacteriales bacterium]